MGQLGAVQTAMNEAKKKASAAATKPEYARILTPIRSDLNPNAPALSKPDVNQSALDIATKQRNEEIEKLQTEEGRKTISSQNQERRLINEQAQSELEKAREIAANQAAIFAQPFNRTKKKRSGSLLVSGLSEGTTIGGNMGNRKTLLGY